jgi:hypothetical protein
MPGLDGQGRHGHLAARACHRLEGVRHLLNGDVLRCDIWGVGLDEESRSPRGPTDVFHCEPVDDGKGDIAFSPSGNVASICGLVSGPT